MDDHTLIVFDWDDTLFPSHWLTSLVGISEISAEDSALLTEIAASVFALLVQAQKHGRVVIITNSEEGWVELSCNRYMSQCSRTLEKIDIVSARSDYQKLYPEEPITWKQLAFRSEVGNATNILSIGDSDCERQGVLALQREGRFIKSVKLPSNPKLEDVKEHLYAISQYLDLLVTYKGDVDVALESVSH